MTKRRYDKLIECIWARQKAVQGDLFVPRYHSEFLLALTINDGYPDL